MKLKLSISAIASDLKAQMHKLFELEKELNSYSENLEALGQLGDSGVTLDGEDATCMRKTQGSPMQFTAA